LDEEGAGIGTEGDEGEEGEVFTEMLATTAGTGGCARLSSWDGAGGGRPFSRPMVTPASMAATTYMTILPMVMSHSPVTCS
jgi:hypothetical protein